MRTAAPLAVSDTSWTPYYPESNACHQVILWETGKAATTGFLIASPTSASGPNTYPAGDVIPLNAPRPNGTFSWGSPAFYIKAVSSPTTVDALEL